MVFNDLVKGLVYGSVSTLLAAGLIALSFYAWGLAYPGDMAGLVFIPLIAALCIAHYRLYARLYRARLDTELQDETILRVVLTGRIKAIATTIAFTAVAIAVMAFETLYSGARELMLLVFVCCTSSVLYLVLQIGMPAHFRSPYSDVNSANLGALLGALPCMLLVYNMAQSGHFPGDVRVTEFTDRAIALLDENIPRRKGLLGKLLEPLIDMEKARAWLTGYIGGAEWVTVSYSVYGALICLIAAKTGVVCTIFVQSVKIPGIEEKLVSAIRQIRQKLPTR